MWNRTVGCGESGPGAPQALTWEPDGQSASAIG